MDLISRYLLFVQGGRQAFHHDLSVCLSHTLQWSAQGFFLASISWFQPVEDIWGAAPDLRAWLKSHFQACWASALHSSQEDKPGSHWRTNGKDRSEPQISMCCLLFLDFCWEIHSHECINLGYSQWNMNWIFRGFLASFQSCKSSLLCIFNERSFVSPCGFFCERIQEIKGLSLDLREWTPSFMRNLHLRHFPAAFCKHPHACKCCCAHTQHTQHTRHAAVCIPRNMQQVIYGLSCMKKLVRMDVSWLREDFRVPGSCPMQQEQSATRSELWLRKLCRSASRPAACLREKGQQAFSQRLAQTGPAALISTQLAGISWKSASHYTFLDQEVKLEGFVLSGVTFTGLFYVFLSL